MSTENPSAADLDQLSQSVSALEKEATAISTAMSRGRQFRLGLFVVLLGVVVYKERLGRAQLVAVVLATVAAVSRASCKEPRSSVKARKIGLFSRLSMTSKGSAIVFSFRR